MTEREAVARAMQTVRYRQQAGQSTPMGLIPSDYQYADVAIAALDAHRAAAGAGDIQKEADELRLLWREAWGDGGGWRAVVRHIHARIAAAVAAERERIAANVEAHAKRYHDMAKQLNGGRVAGEALKLKNVLAKEAAAIRAGGEG